MKQKYGELVKKHSLPDVQQWVVVEEETTVIDIRKAFQEKLYSFADTLDLLLHPEGVASLIEAQVLSEEEHKQIEIFYNIVMLLGKDCMLVDIAASEEDEVAFIKRLCTEWPAIVKELKRIVERTKEAYNGKNLATHNISYLG